MARILGRKGRIDDAVTQILRDSSARGAGMTGNAVVIGATGDVGRGIAKALLADGYQVIAVGRTQGKLDALRSDFPADAKMQAVVGSVADEETGKAAAERVLAFGVPQVVVTTVNGDTTPKPVFDLSTTEVGAALRDNVLTHYAAAKSFIPIIPTGGVYLGVGGGMADLIFPGMVALSMGQAALRNFYRFLAKDPACQNIHVRELMLYSIIAGKSNAGAVEPTWITDDEVGKHVSAILSNLDAFEGPILTVKSRKQIGLPERKPQ
jgi:NAD(P)-dependent dehydrogenase (short-subunit alcohol dehydrogenase family)